MKMHCCGVIKSDVVRLDEKEYDRLYNILEYNVSTRTSLLTFAFTTVLAVLGVALGTENSDISVYMYLIPYCLIIPFSARIVYYRLIHAHISAFLIVYAPEKMRFRLGGSTNPRINAVSEKQTPFFIVIAFLNNFEMSILALTCAAIFYFKFFSEKGDFSIIEWLICLIPIILTIFVIVITIYGYNYSKHLCRYKKKWEELYKKNINEKYILIKDCKSVIHTKYKLNKVNRCKNTQ